MEDLFMSEKFKDWMSEYGENIASIQELYSARVDYLVNITPVAEFSIDGNTVKIWTDNLCGFVYIEVFDWLSLELSGNELWILDYLRANTPYRYVKLDIEKRTVTYCALIFTNDEKIIKSTVQECINSLSNFLNYPNKSDDYEMIYVEDPYTGKLSKQP